MKKNIKEKLNPIIEKIGLILLKLQENFCLIIFLLNIIYILKMILVILNLLMIIKNHKLILALILDLKLFKN